MTVAYEPAVIERFVEEMSRYGMTLSRHTAWELLRKVGDLDLARDAMLLPSRPAWLEKLVGPVPGA